MEIAPLLARLHVRKLALSFAVQGISRPPAGAAAPPCGRSWLRAMPACRQRGFWHPAPPWPRKDKLASTEKPRVPQEETAASKMLPPPNPHGRLAEGVQSCQLAEFGGAVRRRPAVILGPEVGLGLQRKQKRGRRMGGACAIAVPRT